MSLGRDVPVDLLRSSDWDQSTLCSGAWIGKRWRGVGSSEVGVVVSSDPPPPPPGRVGLRTSMERRVVGCWVGVVSADKGSAPPVLFLLGW